MPNDEEEFESVSAMVELSGKYEDIARILDVPERDYPRSMVVVDDMDIVIEIIARTGGATKSHIVDELPSNVTADLDSQNVVHVLRVLELYDLVQLDDNTWRPGPELQTN